MRYFKILFSVGLVAALMSVKAQDMPVDPKTKLITYKQVVNEEGDKDVFYNRAVTWMNTFYKNAFRITTLRDQDAGVIAGKHQIYIYDYTENNIKKAVGTVLYKFKLEFKQGRYRYTLDNFVLKKRTRFPIERWLESENPREREQTADYLKQINEFAEGWVSSLKEGMKPEQEEVEEEW